MKKNQQKTTKISVEVSREGNKLEEKETPFAFSWKTVRNTVTSRQGLLLG